MAEEVNEEEAQKGPVKKYKYNIDLGAHRGKTVQKFTREEAGKIGLSDEDMVDGQDVELVAGEKAAVPKNKAKHAANK